MRLIPQGHFPFLTKDKINQKHHLGVWVRKDIRLKDADGKLNPSAIEIERIPGFSTNKFPRSKKWFLNIQFTKEVAKEYRAEWKEGEEGVYPSRNHYKFNKNLNYYFLCIEDVEGYRGIYQHPVNSQNDFEFELSIVHKPLIANYWHFEFDANSPHGKVKRADKGWQNLACSLIRDRVQDKAKFKM